MRRIRLISAMVVVGLLSGVTRAEVIWQWTHEASGSGTANVFDGGPPVVADENATTGPTDPGLAVSAIDRTQSGSQGASAQAVGTSNIIPTLGETFRISVGLRVGYFPSFQVGGDNPGGEAEGELSSVIEFVMPADEIGWSYQLNINNTFPFPFTGSTEITVENVARSEILLELTTEVVPSVVTTIAGETGDVIRITSVMSGSGSMGPGSRKVYGSTLDMIFGVPEPGTFVLLLVGVRVAGKRKRGSARSRQTY